MGSLSVEVRTEVLCGHICDLEAKNAKLRELGEQYETVLVDYRSEVAKLRELMSDMWNDAVTRMYFADRHEFIDKFLDRLRDLDMEVLEIDAFSQCGQPKL